MGQSDNTSGLIRRPRVLVVDDDRENVEFVERVLRREFEVICVTSTAAAMEKLASAQYDLVIADQRMPEMTGTELLERVRLSQSQARRVLLSAYTEVEDLLAAINNGQIHRFLIKPIDGSELLAWVRAMTSGMALVEPTCLIVDADTERGAELAGAVTALAGAELKVAVAAQVEPDPTLGTVLLMEPSSPQVVAQVVDRLGAANRRTTVFVGLPPEAGEAAALHMNAGADDIIWLPVRPLELLLRHRTWMARRRAEAEAARLRAVAASQNGFCDLIGRSPAMMSVFDLVERAARGDSSILICGETGTGKELVARAVHRVSPRRDGPFVCTNLSAMPEGLIESELCGHEAGAFTGARSARPGRLEAVEGGTLFLDEVGDLPMAVQVKLLRILQERRFERVGSNTTRIANFRLVCATHHDLAALIDRGKFREDLFYRITVVQIDLPPLRERLEDIPLLVEHFLKSFRHLSGARDLRLGDAALNELMTHSWPGNVRELMHVLERAVALHEDGDLILPGLVVGTKRCRPPLVNAVLAMLERGEIKDLDELLTDIERSLLRETLRSCGSNQSAVARKLGIHRTTLRSRLKRLGLEMPNDESSSSS